MIFAELSSTHPEKKEAMIILMLVMLRLVQELTFIHSHNVTTRKRQFFNTNLRQTNIVEAINKLVYIYNAEF